MKLTKKLIPAIGMLMLSAVMLVTSSFAWFSMNENVTATGMQVSAKGEQVYLQIINPNYTPDEDYDNAFVNGKAQTIANANNVGKQLLPTNIKSATTEGEVTTYSDYDASKTLGWVTAIGTAPDGYQALNGYSEAPHSEQTPYYLVNTFKIRLDPTAGAQVAGGALRVSDVAFATGITHTDAFSKTVCVLVKCGSKSELWSNATGDFVKDTKSSENLSDNGNGFFAASADGVSVEIYVFFNGDNVNCTLEALAAANANSLNSYSVDVSFTVAKPQQNNG